MFFVQQLYQKSLITMHNQRVIIAERALFISIDTQTEIKGLADSIGMLTAAGMTM
jgi:hypothetical protein